MQAVFFDMHRFSRINEFYRAGTREDELQGVILKEWTINWTVLKEDWLVSRQNGPTRFDCLLQSKMTTRSTRARTQSLSCCTTAQSSCRTRGSLRPRRRSRNDDGGGRCRSTCGRVLTAVGIVAASPRCRVGVPGPLFRGIPRGVVET